MDIFQIIIIVFFIFSLWLILRFVTKFLFKIVLLFLILVIAFFSFFHFSQKNIFDTMSELYCVQKKSSKKLKCKCFVEYIIEDFHLRNDSLSQEQIGNIKNNIFKSIKEFRESYKNKKEDIYDCFEENGLPGGLGEDLKNDLLKKAKKTTNIFNFLKNKDNND